MPFRLKVSLLVVGLVIVLLAGVPLLVRPGEPPGARPLAEVAGPDAEYVQVEGVDLHVVRRPAEAGAAGRLFLLLHGFPFSTASFDDLAPLLARHGEVVAVDLPGFGLSERPLPGDQAAGAPGLDPYAPEGQVRLVRGLLAELGADEVILLGHDSGARLALDVALDLRGGPATEAAPGGQPDASARDPQLAGLVLVGASPYTSNKRSWLARLVMNSPQLERLGPVFLRQLAEEPGVRIFRAGWADPTAIDKQDLDGYKRPWTVEGWDRAMWQLNKAEPPPSLAGRLGGLSLPALVVAGAADGVVPTGESERLADDLPAATLELVPACGHAVPQECPAELASLIAEWLGTLPGLGGAADR